MMKLCLWTTISDAIDRLLLAVRARPHRHTHARTDQFFDFYISHFLIVFANAGWLAVGCGVVVLFHFVLFYFFRPRFI